MFLAGKRVTTVFDLLLAQYGVARSGLPGSWPTGFDDPSEPYTPAWQEAITGVPAKQAARIAREFADNADRSGGRSMILMGAGTNHWFHSDQIYRAFFTLTLLTGCQGVNGGGWAHYVGQEKCRPVTGWSTLAFATDWQRPPRQMQGTVFWYLTNDQWRYDPFTSDTFASPLGDGRFTGRTAADNIALASRLGWMPTYPTFDRNPLDLADEAEQAGKSPAEHVVDGLKSGELNFACEDPDAPENFPRVLTVWRANLLGSSGKGNEYFQKHLLGCGSNLQTSDATGVRPQELTWREEAPTGKLDLLLSLDFRMTSTTLFSDIVLPAATWYEKHDLSSTDMHPFVHAFSPPSHRRGRPRPISTPSTASPAASPGWRKSISACARTSSRCRCSMIRPTPWPRPVAVYWTGKPVNANPFRVRPCRSWWSSNAITARSRRRWPRSGRWWRPSA